MKFRTLLLALALLLVAGGVSLRLHRHALPGWRQFSIGPASGGRCR